MKRHPKFLLGAVVVLWADLFLILPKKSFAQEINQVVLLAQRQNSRKPISFAVRQEVSFKTVASKKFNKSRITGISDSTMSFENNEQERITIRYVDLIGLRIRGSDVTVDLEEPLTHYNLKHVTIKLKNGNKIWVELLAAKRDSLITKRRRKVTAIGYLEIESVGIHRKGSGGLGALVGGLGGAGLGAIIGTSDNQGSGNFGHSLAVGAGAILGFLVGMPIGAAVGASNTQYLIHGDQEKFHSLTEKINRKLWTLKTSRALN